MDERPKQRNTSQQGQQISAPIVKDLVTTPLDAPYLQSVPCVQAPTKLAFMLVKHATHLERHVNTLCSNVSTVKETTKLVMYLVRSSKLLESLAQLFKYAEHSISKQNSNFPAQLC